MKFTEVVPQLRPDSAQRFLETWYGGREGWAVITRILVSQIHRTTNAALEVENVYDGINQDVLAALCSDEAGSWNVYMSCSLHRENPCKDGWSRGGKRTIDSVHGTWLDLDIKNEAFDSAEQIDDFIRSLGVRPTIVVDSGSGGRHVYWRYTEPVPRDEGEQIADAWWAHACEVAGGVYIDKVTTSDRIMRLPGTIRWPKEAGETPGEVKLIWSEGPLTDLTALRAVSSGAWDRLVIRRNETRRRNENWSVAANASLEGIAGKLGWDRLVALGSLEDLFNESVSWDQILVPRGWKLLGDDHEGRRHWARPGQRGKSAHTDYPPSPHVMKLFSNAPDTGLAGLADAGVGLTKFKVYAALEYGGDYAALSSAILSGRDRLAAGAGGVA